MTAARPTTARRPWRRRVPVVLQTTAVECGLACLAMVLGFHRRFVPVRELRQSLGIGRDGASAGALVREARKHGVQAQGFRADPSMLLGLPMPLIAHWGMNHFVVIERITASGADIVDPASGRRHVDLEELDRSFTGVVLQLEPTEEFEHRARRRVGFVDFVKPYLPKSKRVWGGILLASGALTLLGLLPALLVGYVVDQVIPNQQVDMITVLVLGILIFAAAQAVSTLGRSELLLWLRTRITWQMMRHFLRHLVSLPYKFFQLRHGGDLLQRVSSTAYVRDMVSSQLMAALVDIVLLSVYLTVIGLRSWIYVIVIAAIGGLQVLVILLTATRAQRYAQREMHAMGEAQSALLETVTSVEAVKAAGAENVAVERWSDRYTGELDASVRRERLDNRMDLVLGFLQTLTPVLMTVMGAWLVLGGTLSLGTMLGLNAMAASALAPVTALGQNIKALQTVRVHLDRLRDVLEEEPESTGQGDRELTLTGHITLDKVSFRYDGSGAMVLTDIDLDVRPGEKVAIVGRSGSGKSTLARLMIGLHLPSTGMVSFDGVPFQELDLRSLRQQCGVVTQETQMLSGSILEIITLMRPRASMDDVIRAAKLAAVHDEIVAMPMGYETVLGEGGSGLSGGQLQRLALARALLARPAVLLLDEATSHLDATTEDLVNTAVSELRCTRIVIAHRLSTVRDADRILVVDQGRVVETGAHDELVEQHGHYARLVAHQLR